MSNNDLTEKLDTLNIKLFKVFASTGTWNQGTTITSWTLPKGTWIIFASSSNCVVSTWIHTGVIDISVGNMSGCNVIIQTQVTTDTLYNVTADTAINGNLRFSILGIKIGE